MKHLLPISISKSAFAALVGTGVSEFSLTASVNYMTRPIIPTGHSG